MDMKKTFEMEDLDCAHCAAKMEEAIRKLDGVKSVTVSYIAQKFVLEAEDDRFDDILKEAVKICRKVEPDCRILVK
jgi:copper chaperone CopZ